LAEEGFCGWPYFPLYLSDNGQMSTILDNRSAAVGGERSNIELE